MPDLMSIAMFAIIIIVFYFLMIRPQRKRQKEEEAMRNNLQIGDEIITIGGLYGRVVNIKDDSVVMESVADHSKIKILRGAIQTNLTAAENAKKAAEEKRKQKAQKVQK